MTENLRFHEGDRRDFRDETDIERLDSGDHASEFSRLRAPNRRSRASRARFGVDVAAREKDGETTADDER